jgi:transposase
MGHTGLKELWIHHLNPSIQKLYPDDDYIFQQNNDPKHTANSIKEYLRYKGWEPLPWPGQSPNLNPIKNLWSILNSSIQDRTYKTQDELFLREALPLIDSIPRRVLAVIESERYPTKSGPFHILFIRT